MLWLDCACMMGSSETGWHASTKYVIHCINISYNLFSFPFSLLFVFFFIQEIHLTIFYMLSPWIPFLQIVVPDQSFLQILATENLFVNRSIKKLSLQTLSKLPTITAKTSLLIWDTPQKYFSLGRCFLIPVISDQTKWTLILTKTIFERLGVPEVVAVGGRLWGPGGLRRAIVAERPSPRN